MRKSSTSTRENATTSGTGPPDQDNEEGPAAMDAVESQEQLNGDGVSTESTRGSQGGDSTGGNEKEEISSTDGKGASGCSGGGYQADDDCSSSVSSVGKNADGSLGGTPETDGTKFESNPTTVKARSSNISTQDNQVGPGHRSATQPYALDINGPSHLAHDPTMQRRQHRRLNDQSILKCGQAHLPQWNGIRVQNPMDPRIDLSTVGCLSALNLRGSKHDLSRTSVSTHMKHHMDLDSQKVASSGSTNDVDGQSHPLFPSFEQYMKLMEVSRNSRQPRIRASFRFVCHSQTDCHPPTSRSVLSFMHTESPLKRQCMKPCDLTNPIPLKERLRSFQRDPPTVTSGLVL
jgi:hypothetical protein